MMSGLLSRAHSGFLVRVDYLQDLEYSPEGIEKASRATREFIQALYASLDDKSRLLIFGGEPLK